MTQNSLLNLIDAGDIVVREHLTALANGKSDLVPDLSALAEGLNRLALSDLSRAIQAGELLWQQAPNSAEVRATIQAARANVMCYASRPLDAGAYITEAFELLKQIDRPDARARLHHASVQPLARLGRLADAADAATLAIVQYDASGERTRAALVRMNLGIITRMRGFAGESLAHFEAAAAVLIDDPFALGAIESNRAEALLDLGQFREAETAFRAALKAFSSTNNPHAQAIVEGNLADLLAREGRIEEAISAFEAARTRFEHSGALGDAARLGIEEAEFLAGVGAWREAAAAFVPHLREVEKAGLRREAARATLSFARLALARGRRPSAIAMSTKAVALWTEIGDELSRAEAELVLGIAKGDSDQSAIAHRLDALADRPIRRATLLLDLIDGLLNSQDFSQAQSWLTSRNTDLEAAPLRHIRARAAHARGRVAMSAGNNAAAAEHLRAAVLHAESLEAQIPAGHLASGLATAWEGLYSDACVTLLDSGDPSGIAQAFEVNELFHSRALLRTTVPESGTDSTLPTNSTPAARQYAECIIDLRATYSLVSDPRPSLVFKLPELRQKLDELEIRAEGLRRRAAASLVAPSAFEAPMSLEAVQQALPPNAGIVMFFAEAETYSALVITQGDVRSIRRIAAADAIRNLVRRGEFEIDLRGMNGRETASTAGVSESLELLGELIWRPLRDATGSIRHLGIVPTGQLSNVAWSALKDAEGWLIDRHTLTLMASASSSLRLAAANRPKEQSTFNTPSVLAIGVADSAAPEAQSEAERVAAVRSNSMLLVGEKATADAVLEAIPHARIVHIASHGIDSPRFPMSSRIKLADRWVTARELAGRFRPGAIVTFSGCETARVGDDDPDAIPGFARAVLAGGAVAAVGSRWPLRDSVAANLFPDLISRIVSGIPPAQALRETQIASRTNEVSPLDWGGLMLTGALQ